VATIYKIIKRELYLIKRARMGGVGQARLPLKISGMSNYFEGTFLNAPHKLKDSIPESKKEFFELAKSRVKHMSREEFIKWHEEMFGDAFDAPASNLIIKSEAGEIENLEIAINRDAFKIDNKDYSDLIPCVIEHETYEAWIEIKEGAMKKELASGKDEAFLKKHLLAERNEFLMAERMGLGEKLFEWRMKIAPEKEAEFRACWESAKKKIGGS